MGDALKEIADTVIITIMVIAILALLWVMLFTNGWQIHPTGAGHLVSFNIRSVSWHWLYFTYK